MLRLPNGRTAVEEVIVRCSKIPGITHLVAAIPSNSDSDMLALHIVDIAKNGVDIMLVRGPEDDVLARYALAARVVDADIIMRITADCQLLDPSICGLVLRKMLDERLDFCSNCFPRTYPDGYDCEIFTRKLLNDAHENAVNDVDRQHVTPWMTRRPYLKRGNVAQDVDESQVRLTLDDISDYIAICNKMMADGANEAAGHL